ncbi:MAG: hypothetical protein M1819_007296 [Sarea resinae]|nr:MAG: hypothetical protein M1819_007296 [Sarea resinae]
MKQQGIHGMIHYDFVPDIRFAEASPPSELSIVDRMAAPGSALYALCRALCSIIVVVVVVVVVASPAATGQSQAHAAGKCTSPQRLNISESKIFAMPAKKQILHPESSRSPSSRTVEYAARTAPGRKRTRDEFRESPKTDLVDGANALSLEEFAAKYLPADSPELLFRARVPQQDEQHTRNNGPDDAIATKANANTTDTTAKINGTNTTSPGTDPMKTYTITLASPDTMPAEDLTACLSLIAQTSKHLYVASSLGWSPRKKRAEMRTPGMKYLVVRESASPISAEKSNSIPNPNSHPHPHPDSKPNRDNSNNKSTARASPSPSPTRHQPTKSHPHPPPDAHAILAFLSFLPTLEASRQVLYIYELHLHPRLRRRGLGSHLLSLAERLAARLGLSATMLTVFVRNAAARAFYGRLGYVVDEAEAGGGVGGCGGEEDEDEDDRKEEEGSREGEEGGYEAAEGVGWGEGGRKRLRARKVRSEGGEPGRAEELANEDENDNGNGNGKGNGNANGKGKRKRKRKAKAEGGYVILSKDVAASEK